MDEGWDALKGTPRELDRSRYREIPGSMPARQPCRSGFSPREAEATLRSVTVPAWAFAALAAFVAACTLLALGSLVSLLSGAGLSAVRILLATALFGALFAFAFRHLWRDRRRRERAWRDRLEAWHADRGRAECPPR